MPLVNTTEMFKKAYEGGYAIGAFNVNNMEIIQGITEACHELRAPVILQVSAGARKYANHPLSCARNASTAGLLLSCSTVPPNPMRRTWRKPAVLRSMLTNTM